MKSMIVNKTNLDNQTIGKMMDQIIGDFPGETLYYGKTERYKMLHGKIPNRKCYEITIRYLKNYTQWIFTEVQNESIHKRK